MPRKSAMLCLAAATLSLAACGLIPRDPDETLSTIAASKKIRVGVIADPDPTAPDRAAALLDRLSRETGAIAERQAGAAEPLLDRLQHGELDLVIGVFTEETPWAAEVALAPPLAAKGSRDRQLQLRAAARNGENAWIMMVERASRAVAPEEARQ